MTVPRSLLAVCAAGALVACGGPDDARPVEADAVARVGSAVLSEADVADALGEAPPGLDSSAARSHVVEQWIQRELLVQEARREGLDQDPEIRRRIAESERATLEAAALERLFAANPTQPDTQAVRRYYDAHRADLALREPYVRLRHLRVASPQAADDARAALDRAVPSPHADSLFTLIAKTYADDPQGAIALATTWVPEGRLLSLDEALGQRVVGLSAGGRAAVVPSAGTIHVVQVAERASTGTVPPLAMIRAELTERLAIQNRRDTEARAIQQLRAEAEARGRLVAR